ncbi:DUF397 domain-containing protein [Actinomadura sp. 3N407]|uniref:DUF397 domain-containing protein n=1 Tax=Actinomadura sp. 3N407 TaxID=3457423 RepID=UPI003FCE2528
MRVGTSSSTGGNLSHISVPTATGRKSRQSMSANDCVEIAVVAPHTIGVRDSKAPDQDILTLDPGHW